MLNPLYQKLDDFLYLANPEDIRKFDQLLTDDSANQELLKVTIRELIDDTLSDVFIQDGISDTPVDLN